MGLAKAGGCLLEIVGTTRLSELEIDADKNWGEMCVSNIREVAEAMEKGDIVFFDGTKLVKLAPGSIGAMLTTQDVGENPIWSY